MGIGLSHTAKNKYINCPLSYYMHYILKLREEVVGSALPFGTAIDSAQETLLKGKTLDQALKVFNEAWIAPKINGNRVDGPTTKFIKFSKADGAEGLADTAWGNMKEKGELLLTAYQEEIMPRIKDVLAVQKPIFIKNDQGDFIRGFADKIVVWEDGRNILFDNKTGAKKYESDAVTVGDKAKQLGLYYEALKDEYSLDASGFIVLEKKIRKNEPRTRIQILIDNVPEDLIQETFDEFEEVLHNIKLGIFPSNHPDCNQYYGDCVCNKYYPSGGTDLTGLIKVGK